MKNGFTLIELLIGIVIAMLCMIMMLMLFKQISKISLQSMQDADYDTQAQTGALIIQKLVQNAGYGIDRSSNPTAVQDISLAQFNGKPAIFWRFLSSNPTDTSATRTYTCEALISENDLVNKEYKLFMLSYPNNCGPDLNPSTASLWSDPSRYTKSPLVTIRNPEITASTDPIFSFNLSDMPVGKNCTPYGISENNPAGSKYVTVTARSKDLAIKDIQQVICLNNIFRSTT